jgi:cephalosporin hydroxylase/glycosyltransferase involved in cell wall biosynthesis
MFPFWEIAIRPVLEAVRARRVIEIGALRGETTTLMLECLGADAELHVIDPAPEFDPAEHERAFPGRYIFHHDISHNVLPLLPPADIALIDGDHNWYTAYHELKMLSATAHDAGSPFPILMMHDVCWPYGRRDLYYAPERIPEEFRQPYAQRGIHPDRKEVLKGGGLNPTMNNAISEGGDRNGVMTALDDFMAEYDRPLRRLVLPIYFGLAIVVEEAVLRSNPELAAVIDRLSSGESKNDLLELAESVRLQAMLFQHNVFYRREQMLERATSRYLDLLKSALLDEHYLDNEVRLWYVADCISRNRTPNKAMLRDPVRQMKQKKLQLQNSRRTGALSEESDWSTLLPFTDMGRTRLEALEKCLDRVRTNGVEGHLVDCGTGRGGAAIFMRGYIDAHELTDRAVWVADSFRASKDTAAGLLNLSADLNIVRDGFRCFDLLDERVYFLQGLYGETLPSAPIDEVALLRIGGGVGGSSRDVLDALYGKVAPGGLVVIDGYAEEACQRAVDEFRSVNGLDQPVERLDWTGICWQKGTDEDQIIVGAQWERTHGLSPATSQPGTSKDLSVVIVFYNMRREARRTLHSLSRAYQRGLEDLEYEVIVVENGSDDDQRLGEEFVCSFGPEFQYLDLGTEATPTPAVALNRGLAVASGEAIAFMIDGAHVLTPGVLRHGMAGLATYAPAIVVTQQWYVGPGQQGNQQETGYDRRYEDRLFERIEWPVDGYRLFDISHFIGDRDWLDGLWESNCMFVPRKLLEQAGGYDEGFAMAGGGYANLDFYERMGSTPGVNVVTILGEGSFHQLHGGMTTNQLDSDGRRERIYSYADQYAELRGRPFKGPGKTIHYVGTMFQGARRTRARRMTASAFCEARIATGPDGRPTGPSPIPDELTADFTDAFWHSLAWRDTTWLGRKVYKAPTDLVVYQELIHRVRPDWIIETGTGGGGRALFLASVCDLVEHGHVLSIDRRLGQDLPRHPRITYIEGLAHEEDAVRQVKGAVGADPHALVILGSAGSHLRMIDEFEAFHALVPVGSYAVVEETIVNGHPVWPGFGAGPFEATKRILAAHGNFASDPKMEKYALTFNPGGFLKRLR